MLVELANKVPGGKQLAQYVEDRINTALMKLGMDIDGWNLPRGQEKELANLTEALNGYTDEEAGQLVQHVASELTPSDVAVTMKSDDTVLLKSKNMKLEGTKHPETNVAFEKVQFELDGNSYEVVAAQFEKVG